MADNPLRSLPTLEDAPLSPTEIFGTHVYEDVLYCPSRAEDEVPVNVLTGEPAADLKPATVAKRFAEETGENRVAVPRGAERIADTGGSAYVSTFFADSKVTRGKPVGTGEYGRTEYENGDRAHDLEWTYRAAWKSDEYDVSFEADYESGDVTITVELVDEDGEADETSGGESGNGGADE